MIKIKVVVVQWNDGSLEEGIFLGKDRSYACDRHWIDVYFPKRFLVLDRIQAVRDRQIVSRNEVEVESGMIEVLKKLEDVVLDRLEVRPEIT